ncbi:hypothetical protein MKW98_028432, partial [Papaver atlanticum]
MDEGIITISMLLADWKRYPFDEKAIELDHLLTDVGSKLRTSRGVYVPNEMSEDLKLIK